MVKIITTFFSILSVLKRRLRGASFLQSFHIIFSHTLKIVITLFQALRYTIQNSSQPSQLEENTINGNRDWIQSLDEDVASCQNELIVMSYNVLAPVHTTPRILRFPNCPATAMEWDYRERRIIADVVALSADVVCFQEVQAGRVYTSLCNNLEKQGYIPISIGLTLRQKGRQEGCAIFYAAHKLNECHSDSIEIGKALQKQLNISENVANSVGLNHGTVAQLALFESKQSGQMFWINNIHVVNLWQRPDIQTCEIATMLHHSHQTITDVREGVAHIVCGDFNAQPNTLGYRLMNGSLNVDEQVRKSTLSSVIGQLGKHWCAPQKFISTYSALRAGEELPFTNLTIEFQGTLDYIWLADDDRLAIKAVLNVPREQEACPNWANGSDHLPICTKLVWM